MDPSPTPAQQKLSHPIESMHALTPDQIQVFKARWINTVEELVVALATDSTRPSLAKTLCLEDPTLTDILAAARTIVGEAAYANLEAKATGHAIMPPAHVERFGLEAFTGPASSETLNREDGEFGKYTSKLSEEMRDVEDKLLVAGTRIIRNPDEPSEVMEDSVANRQRFKELSHGWTGDTRTRAWFGSATTIPAELNNQLRRIEACAQEFDAALSENLEGGKDGLRGHAFPSIREPAWYRLLPWEPSVKRVERIADLSSELVSHLTQQVGVPQNVRWPDGWLAALRAVNRFSIYRVFALATSVDVVVAFLTPLTTTGPSAFTVSTPDVKCISLVQEIYNRWSQSAGSNGARFVYFTVGFGTPWDASVQASTGGRYWISCSAPASDARWHHSAPRRYGDRVSLSDFLDRLKPETRKQRNSHIKEFVDSEFGDGQTVDVERVKRLLPLVIVNNDSELGYRRTLILEAFEDMQNRSGYHVYKTKGLMGVPDGLVAIRQSAGKGEFRLRPLSVAPRGLADFRRVPYHHCASGSGSDI